jgi:hypothetical protein
MEELKLIMETITVLEIIIALIIASPICVGLYFGYRLLIGITFLGELAHFLGTTLPLTNEDRGKIMKLVRKGQEQDESL